jgi:aryl-alcohol dehydrogenase-like predicted oxidoreductase
LGARSVEQLDDNLGAAGMQLSEEERARLDAVSAPEIDDYPYGEMGVEQRDRSLSS